MSFLEQMRQLKRDEVRRRMALRRPGILEAVAADRPHPPGFMDALHRPPGEPLRIIAEVKRASPSAGSIREGFDALYLARSMVLGGAAAVSVLTEERYFQGSLEDLSRVAAGVPVPVMRKDFIIDAYQLLEARVAGASACLLIAALLGPADLRRLQADADALGLASLVEVHSRRELEDALESGARVIGINNRNLTDLSVNTGTTIELLQHMPPDRLSVSESGLRSRSDLEVLEETPLHAVLIGEAIMRSEDVGQKVRELLGNADADRHAIPPRLLEKFMRDNN